MDPKYQVTYKYDEELFKKYNYALFTKGNKSHVSIIIVCSICLVAAIGFGLFFKGFFWPVIYIILGAAFPLLMKLRIDSVIKRTWSSNTAMQNMENNVFFYDDHLEQKNKTGEIRYDYSEIYKVFDDDFGIYIMIARNMGICIRRDACSEEAIEFIKGIKA